MTKANELVDATINFISFVKKGANGDPLRILKADDSGAGLDLASLNKAAVDDNINVPVNIPKNDVPEVKPSIDPEVIQKLNILGVARSLRSANRHLRAGARAGYRLTRRPSLMSDRALARNLVTATGHMVRSRAGIVGVAAGANAGTAMRFAAGRVAAARMRGARIGQGLRAGYGLAREVHRANRAGYSVGPNSPAWRALAAAHRAGARRSVQLGARAGIAQAHVQHNANRFRTWVRDASTRGGGYWRRNA